jgi:peptide deformylase
LRAIGERLVAAARAANAFGLAAAHIGEVAPVVVVSSDGQGRDYTLLFNPKITASATDTTKGEEGSVSLPGIRVEVERAAWVEVTFQDELGAAKATRFDGFAARVAAHEIDQMNGVFFLESVSRLKRDMALKKARKLPG